MSPLLAFRAPFRSPHARRRRFAAASVVAAAAAVVVTGVASPAAAQAGGVRLQSTFAGPIAASNKLCTAEPRGLIYGTTNYNPSQPLTHRSHGYPLVGFYEPANAPSFLDLVPQLQSAARSDLCVGFTLPPNVEEQLIRTWYDDLPRLQDDPAWPDVAETHTSSFPTGSLPVQGDDLRGLSITLPAGYAADFAGATRCSDADFAATSFTAPTCPTSSQVGEAFVRVSAYAAGKAGHEALPGLALTNLTPRAGEVGRLGVAFQAAASVAPVKWTFAVRFAADGSGRLVASLADAARITYDTTAIAKAGDTWGGTGPALQAGDERIGQPQPSAPTRPLYVEGLGLRLWGSKANHATMAGDFGGQAGRCDPGTAAGFDAGTYAGTTSSATSLPFALADCASLALPASGTVVLADATAGAATGATVSVTLPQTGTRLPAQPSAISLTLPDGLELGPQLASGSDAQPICAAADFASTSPASAAACIDASSIGTATLQPHGAATAFTGPIHLGPPAAPGDLAALGLDLTQPAGDQPAARLKLTGALRIGTGGEVTIHFSDLPSLRFSALSLALRGGDHAILTAPRSCGVHAGGLTVERAAGDPTTAPLPLEIGGCSDEAAALGLAAAPSTARSGDRPATSVSITRGATAAAFERLAIALPPGSLLNRDAVAACGAVDAAAGTCSADSQVGAVRLAAGAGARPLQLSGTVHLTAAGVVLLADAALGDLQLGRIVAPGSLRTGDAAGSLTLSTELPTRLGGIALDLRRVTIDLDRDGAVRHPTACGDLPVRATLSGAADVQLATTVSYPRCGALPFAPGFAASVSNDAATAGHPKVVAVVTPGGSDAAVSSVRLAFPRTVALDPARASSACAQSAFDAGACAGGSRVGQIAARVSMLPDALSADAFLVRTAGGSLAIGARFGGVQGHAVLGQFSTGHGGAPVLSFGGLPDLPFERWALQLDGGAAGLLSPVAPAGGCAAGASWTADLSSHNGASQRRTAAAPCVATPATAPKGTPPTVALSISAKTGLKLKLTDFGPLQLQTVKLTMPKSIRINAPKAKRRGRAPFALIGAKGATPAFTSGSIALTPWGGVPSEVVARLRTTAYAINGRAPERVAGTLKGKRRNAEFVLRMGFRDGSVQTRRLVVRLP